MDKKERKELLAWIDIIEDRARGFGLDFYPQEFIIESQDRAKEHLAYSGLVPRYTHWSFGKAYDRLETLYKYGIFSHLPYELVINSNPCQAFLLDGNSLAIQILVIAHVYAHNDFFKNNCLFSHTRPEDIIDIFSEHADRIDRLIQRVGEKNVEDALTAAHAIRAQRLSLPGSRGHQDGFNILRFIIEERKGLPRWRKEILKIVDREWEYFVPQIETKIMNEGWAAYWHTRIIEGLDLSQNLMMEFFEQNSKIVFGIQPGAVNPYNVGYTIFSEIKRKWDRMAQGNLEPEEKWDGRTGDEKLFEVRRVKNDSAFVDEFLSLEAAEACHLVKYDESKEREVVAISDEEGIDAVREELSRNVGIRIFPVVRGVDNNHENKGRLWLKHEFDGRSLDIEYLRKTLEHIYYFWGESVYLETVENIEMPTFAGGRIEIKHSPFCHAFNGKEHFQYPILSKSGEIKEEDVRLLEEYIKALAKK